MSNRIARILLFSDPHFSIDSRIEEEKWFPPICNLLQKMDRKLRLKFSLVEKFLGFWDRITQKYTRILFEKVSLLGSYDFLIGFGDYTPGANESGMITRKSVGQFDLFIRLLNKHLRHLGRLFVWGDHDTGYKFEVSKKSGIKIGSETGGISATSILTAQKLLGSRPYGFFNIGKTKFIFISTNLIRAANDKNSRIRLLSKLQSGLAISELMKEDDSNLIFLLLHDPTALHLDSMLMNTIQARSRKGKMVIIHGHMHAEYSAFLTRILYAPYRELYRNFQVITVPAPLGMFGIGKGFKVLNLFNDGGYEIEKHRV